MHTDGGNIFEIFLPLPILKKNQILVILPKNAISLGIYHEISSNFLSVWGDVIFIIYQTGFIM